MVSLSSLCIHSFCIHDFKLPNIFALPWTIQYSLDSPSFSMLRLLSTSREKSHTFWVNVLQLHGTLCKPAPRRITQFCWFCSLSWFSVVAVLSVHVLFMFPIPRASVVIKKYLSDACCVFWSMEK